MNNNESKKTRTSVACFDDTKYRLDQVKVDLRSTHDEALRAILDVYDAYIAGELKYKEG